jgi:hypothetical protein
MRKVVLPKMMKLETESLTRMLHNSVSGRKSPAMLAKNVRETLQSVTSASMPSQRILTGVANKLEVPVARIHLGKNCLTENINVRWNMTLLTEHDTLPALVSFTILVEQQLLGMRGSTFEPSILSRVKEDEIQLEAVLHIE